MRQRLEALVMWARTFGSAVVYATLIVTFIGQVARVDGFSMQPTLQHEDRLIVNKLAYELHTPAIGDVVMLISPTQPDEELVKRIVAGPGDRVRAVDGQVFVNDIAVDQSFVAPEFRSFDSWPTTTVPPAHYFVMGDHRNNSRDSRAFQFVPQKYILGKVQLRWWPISQARLFH